MKKFYLLLLLLLAVCVSSTQVFAQNTRRAARAAMRAKSREMSKFTVKRSFGKSKQYSAVGGFLGAANYYGDLAPKTRRLSTSTKLTRTYFGGFYQKRINANFSWRVALVWARLRGDDFNASRTTVEGEYRYKRNLNFRNDVIETSIVAVADVFPIDRGYLRRDFFNFYGMLGVEIFYHNPKGYVAKGYGLADEGKWISLRPLGTEGQGLGAPYKKKYSLIQPGIVLGGGVKYRASDKLDIGLEFGWRFTFTDYLDDVSGTYVKDADALAAHPDVNGADKLWWVMSNKSGLPTGGGSDQTRSWGDANSSNPAPTYQVYRPGGSNPIDPWVSTPAQPQEFRRIAGYGVKDALNSSGDLIVDTGSPRGHKPNDGYTVTTLTATYILEFRTRTPKFR